MTNLERWHDFVRHKNPDLLDELLDEDCVFYSPVVHTPQRGRDISKLYLAAAMQVLDQDFSYDREVVDGNEMVLEFSAVSDGIQINGVDMIRWNDAGQIVEFKVMVRPLKAINQLHGLMRNMLEQMAGQVA